MPYKLIQRFIRHKKQTEYILKNKLYNKSEFDINKFRKQVDKINRDLDRADNVFYGCAIFTCSALMYKYIKN